MPAYFVALDYAIVDQEGLDAIVSNIADVVVAHGGSYVVRGAPTESLGSGTTPVAVTISKFDSADDIRAMLASDAMIELRNRRREVTECTTFIVEGA